jgi:benzoyl-CoA reductase/2-hydroxyglutaryl-CoA dehydratase subunit BcrC/BadD/HgdB
VPLNVVYSSPFVPPEWIEAHGIRPVRLGPAPEDRTEVTAAMGMCSYAAWLCRQAEGTTAAGVIVTTTCDQMRRASEVIAEESGRPTFLLNVPATWQSAAARLIYRDELKRLGRFLQRLGGVEPSREQLCATMLRYDEMRRELRRRREMLGARDYALAIAAFGRTGGVPEMPARAAARAAGIALGVIGGPMRMADLRLLDLIEQGGGRVVLDATETGERGLVAPFDHRSLLADPAGELANAYLASIPEAFRRPNTHLYDYLRQEIASRGIRGLVLIRRVWCDVWHAERERMREETGLPVIEVDLEGSDGELAGAKTRVESMLEMFTGAEAV